MNIKKIFDFSDHVIVITGAAGLLGSEYANGFCQAGANVVLADINLKKCKKLAKQLQSKFDVEILTTKLDVTNPESIKKMVNQVMKKFSKIDVLVNNAIFPEIGKIKKTSFEDFPLNIWKKGIDVNLTGMFLCSQQIGKVMIKQKNGVIVNISSVYGLVGPDQRIYGKTKIVKSAMYATTKGAVLNFTKYLASYWNRTGIRVNTLSLGGVEEDQDKNIKRRYSEKTMIGRMAKKDEYVAALLFLSSDASSYMTGSNLVIDGGWTAW
jgi:NAD(P)-dependent dehydrogenase (short-subunit alcohol dehydrogenase family)